MDFLDWRIIVLNTIMNTNYQNTPLLDIIFENRNKQYGAYVLRNEYNRSLRFSLLVSLSLVASLLMGHFLHQKFNDKPSLKLAGPLTLTDVDITQLQKIITPPVETPKPRAQGKQTIKNPELRVVATANANQDSIPSKDLLAQVDPGLTTNSDPNLGTKLGTEGGVKDGDVIEVKQVTPPAPVIHDVVTEMPKFPGGDEALFRVLRDRTRYPEMEMNADMEGKAFIRFVVNEDGSISNATVLRTDSRGFGQEGVRVVSSLPKFRPGKQNGEPVKVYFVLPFTFKLSK